MPKAKRVGLSQSLRDASRSRSIGALVLATALLTAAVMPAFGEPWIQPAPTQAANDELGAALGRPDDDDAPATTQAIAVLLGGAPPVVTEAAEGPVGELPLAGLQRLVLAEGQRLGQPVDHTLFVPRPPSASDAPLLVDRAIDALNPAPNNDLLQALAAPPPWPLLVVIVLVMITIGVLVAQQRRHAHRRHRSEYHPGHSRAHDRTRRHGPRLRLRASPAPAVPPPQA